MIFEMTMLSLLQNNYTMNTRSGAQNKQKSNLTAIRKQREREGERERQVQYARASRKAKKEQLQQQTLLINQQEATIKQLQLAVHTLQQTIHEQHEQHTDNVQKQHTSDTDTDTDTDSNQTKLYSDCNLANPCCDSSLDYYKNLHQQNDNMHTQEEVSIEDEMHAQLLASHTRKCQLTAATTTTNSISNDTNN